MPKRQRERYTLAHIDQQAQNSNIGKSWKYNETAKRKWQKMRENPHIWIIYLFRILSCFVFNPINLACSLFIISKSSCHTYSTGERSTTSHYTTPHHTNSTKFSSRIVKIIFSTTLLQALPFLSLLSHLIISIFPLSTSISHFFFLSFSVRPCNVCPFLHHFAYLSPDDIKIFETLQIENGGIRIISSYGEKWWRKLIYMGTLWFLLLFWQWNKTSIRIRFERNS